MPVGQDRFDLDACLAAMKEGLAAVVCHIGFDAAIHGLIFAVVVGLAGLSRRNDRFGKPLVAVSRKLALFCLILLLPGALSVAFTGRLPSTGTFQISSLGFIVFWTLITLHLCAEEMNFQWFPKT